MKQRFPVRYAGLKGLVLRVFLVLQRWSYVAVGPDRLKIRMSYGFTLRVRRSNVAHVARAKPVLLTAGVHGWRGRWIVNGASRPMVAITLKQPARARVLALPIRVCEVHVSVDDPDALVAALR